MRTDALLSRYGYCSRRETAAWLAAGRVTCKGIPVRNGKEKVEPADVMVDGAPVEFAEGLYVALNKPLGCTCSHKEEGELVYDLLPPRWLRRNPGVNTVGRLDKETSGLLLLTDDGAFEHRLTSPKKHVPKVYRFVTSAPVPESTVALFAEGTLMLESEKTPCLPAELVLTAPCEGELTLHEGRYHQVRRMLAAVGAPVIELERIAVGSLRLVDLNLAPGEWCAIDKGIFD